MIFLKINLKQLLDNSFQINADILVTGACNIGAIWRRLSWNLVGGVKLSSKCLGHLGSMVVKRKKCLTMD
jgi:hypothetical protein